MTGAHRRPVPPCPAWCEISPHVDQGGDYVIHQTTPDYVANVSVCVTQTWESRAGWYAPQVLIARIGSGRSARLLTPGEVRAIAEIFDSTRGALPLRRVLYATADQFERILFDHQTTTTTTEYGAQQ